MPGTLTKTSDYWLHKQLYSIFAATNFFANEGLNLYQQNA